MEVSKKMWGYLIFKKQNGPKSFNLKMMHGINRISIFLFLAGVIYMIIRFSK